MRRKPSNNLNSLVTDISADWLNKYTTRQSSIARLNFVGREIKSFFLENESRLKKPIRTLDFGCGPGIFGAVATEFADEVILMDQSEAMLKSFKDNEKLLADIITDYGGCYISDHITIINADEHRLKEFEDKSFLLITAIGVYEYISSPLNTLSEMLRCLDDKGVLLLSIPNEKSLFRKIEPTLNFILINTGKLLGIKRFKHREYTGFKAGFNFPNLNIEIPKLDKKILKIQKIPLGTRGMRKVIYPNLLFIIGEDF